MTGQHRGPREGRPPSRVSFPALGLSIRDGQVYAAQLVTARHLGPLAGAEARISPAPRRGRRGLLARGHAAAPAVARVVLADGASHERRLPSGAAVRRAMCEVAQFRLMAEAAGGQR